jgi:hypothetical protein
MTIHNGLTEVTSVGGGSSLRMTESEVVVKSWLSYYALESIENTRLSRHNLIIHTRFERSLDVGVDRFRTSGCYVEDRAPSWQS